MQIVYHTACFRYFVQKFFTTTIDFFGAYSAARQYTGEHRKGKSFCRIIFTYNDSCGDIHTDLAFRRGAIDEKAGTGFAEYFFRAVNAHTTSNEVPPEWKNYFNGNGLTPLQLKLIGTNAHINGDLWQALVNSFSLEEIKKLKPFYKNYNKKINKVFSDLFESAIGSDKRLRELHSITLGLDKIYGKVILRKWRNRQLRLAMFNFERQEKFGRLKKRTDRKREKIDRMIIKRLG